MFAREPCRRQSNPRRPLKRQSIRLDREALLFIYATITHFLGTHLPLGLRKTRGTQRPRWGCFIAGMSFACLDPPHHAHYVARLPLYVTIRQLGI